MFFYKVYGVVAVLVILHLVIHFYKEAKRAGKLHKYGPYQWTKVFLYFTIAGILWAFYALYFIIKHGGKDES